MKSEALDRACREIKAKVHERLLAMRRDAEERKARGEPPKVVRLQYDAEAGPNLAQGAPRFKG